MSIARVWIEPGCIRCSACHYTAPQVFHLPDNADAVVHADARADGIHSPNVCERACLAQGYGQEHGERIRDAADGCPVGIIHFEEE